MKSVVHRRILYSIIVALIITLLVMFASVPSKSKALEKLQYKAVPCNMQTSAIQTILDRYSGQGWELVAVEASMGHLIFKK